MIDELGGDEDDGGGRAALVIGFGEPGEDSELPRLLKALTRAQRTGDFERAAELFTEAVAVCKDEGAKPKERRNPFKERGDSDDDDDLY